MCGRPFRYTQYVILTAAGAVCRGSFGVHSLGSFLLQALCSWPLRCGVPALFHCSFEALSKLFRSSIGVRGTSWRLLAAALPIPAGLRGVSCVKCKCLYYTAVLYLPIFCSSSTGRIESACLAGRPAACR